MIKKKKEEEEEYDRIKDFDDRNNYILKSRLFHLCALNV